MGVLDVEVATESDFFGRARDFPHASMIDPRTRGLAAMLRLRRSAMVVLPSGHKKQQKQRRK